MQMTMAGSADVKSKNLEKEIADKEQQMQKAASKEELSVEEKADQRKKLQREISGLRTELERYQEEALKSQKREKRMAELQKEAEPVKEGSAAEQARKAEEEEEDTSPKEISAAESADMSARQAGLPGTVIVKNSDGTVIFKGKTNEDEGRSVDRDQKQTDEARKGNIAEEETASKDEERNGGLAVKETEEMVSADASTQQAGRQEKVIARIRGDIAVLKGEINQDEIRGADTDQKQAELEKLEKKEERARLLPFSVLGEADSTERPAAQAKASVAQTDAENNVFPFSTEEEQASQQRFHVSLRK